MKYTICIGSLIYGEHHSEVEVDSYDEAVAHLHALAKKHKPEQAIANIGDFRAWVGNSNSENADLSRNQKLASMIDALIKQENESDKQAELDVNQHVPDIQITPIKEGVVMVSSAGMRCELPIGVADLEKTIAELVSEFQDLIAAGELSTPVY